MAHPRYLSSAPPPQPEEVPDRGGRHVVETYVAAAPRGRGSVVWGPKVPNAPELGSMILAPPGVWLRSPEDWEVAFTRRGWRAAIWGRDAQGSTHPYTGRPVQQDHVTLEWAYRWAIERDPELDGWVRREVAREIRAYIRLLIPVNGVPAPRRRAEPARASLHGVVVDAAALFGDNWVREQLDVWAHLLHEPCRAVSDRVDEAGRRRMDASPPA